MAQDAATENGSRGARDPDSFAPGGPWWRGLTPYMWWVLVAAALGWVFDVMDQRIFTLTRAPALDELLARTVPEDRLIGRPAAEVAGLLGIAPGTEPQALTLLEEAAASGQLRDAILFPPLEPGGAPRRLKALRPESPGGGWRVVAPPEQSDLIGRLATAIFIIGWATGGIVFGILGDKLGRARTMLITILVYSVFTGLSALSFTWIDYALYRFLTGMGVGGEFAAGAALVAEVMPARARPYALGLLQALSAFGNILGSLLGAWLLEPREPTAEWDHWRLLYLVGILPALLIVIIRGRLKEPERWVEARASATGRAGPKLGSFGELFAPSLRRSTVLGLLLAATGVIGVWGIAFWTPELIRDIGLGSTVRSQATALQDVGAFLGIASVTLLTQGAARSKAGLYGLGLGASVAVAVGAVILGAGAPGSGASTMILGVASCLGLYFLLALVAALRGGLGRRVSFVVSFGAAWVAVWLVFQFLRSPGQVFWMIPIFGFCTLLCFGLYAIYFPELYPTRLRTTGTGFCYNVARYVAAVGIFGLGYLGSELGFRTATLIFSSVYLVGIVAAVLAPETKDRPLAE